MLLRPATRLHSRQQRLDQHPLPIGQIRGITPFPRHTSTVDASTPLITPTRRPPINFSNPLLAAKRSKLSLRRRRIATTPGRLCGILGPDGAGGGGRRPPLDPECV